MAGPRAALITPLRNIQTHRRTAATPPTRCTSARRPASARCTTPCSRRSTDSGRTTYERASKKTCVSLRRRRQFAMLGPATRDRVEVGLNCGALPAHPRPKLLSPAGMCRATTRIGRLGEVDESLAGRLRAACDAGARRPGPGVVRRRRIRCRGATAAGREVGFPRGLAMLGPWEVRAGRGSGVPQRMPSGASPRPPGAPR